MVGWIPAFLLVVLLRGLAAVVFPCLSGEGRTADHQVCNFHSSAKELQFAIKVLELVGGFLRSCWVASRGSAAFLCFRVFRL